MTEKEYNHHLQKLTNNYIELSRENIKLNEEIDKGYWLYYTPGTRNCSQLEKHKNEYTHQAFLIRQQPINNIHKKLE